MLRANEGARAGGLTLVELVVALAVLSMVALVLGASLRGMGQTALRLDGQAARLDEQRVARAFLLEVTSRISPQSAPTAPPRLLFEGGPQVMQWVAIMPARFGAAGRHFFRLALEPVDGQPALVLRFAPWPGPSDFPDWSQAESRVLARAVSSLVIDYGGQGWTQDWTPRWQQPTLLPPRVRITLASAASGDWVPLVLPLRMALPATGGFTVGGSTR